MPYVLDTNIFNWLIDGRIQPADLPVDGDYVATHVQIDELNKTGDADRRAMLFLKFAEIRPKVVPTESTVWDVSRWDQAKWGNGDVYQRLKAELDILNKAKPNNIFDALIAEVAIVNGYTLLTADSDLAKTVDRHGCAVRLYES